MAIWQRIALVLLLTGGSACAEDLTHPRLLLTPGDAATIRAEIAESPGFERSLNATRKKLDRYFSSMPDVPVPADAGGGYTHEQHKRNGVAIHDAGIIYQLTGDESYFGHARTLLLAYAELYPTLGEHPKKKEQTPGRLFWQSLNEAVWLVYAIQGYDAIMDQLSAADRKTIEAGLLRPLAEFLSAGQPQTFDKIHNHGTWAVAAVGMTGYVLGDEAYVNKSLYGLKEDGESGFLKQLDMLFSPDGYYNEGPYYQRYALMPFVLFARSIEANNPGLKIFEYRDSILLKAIRACIDLSYAGLFFPINDAIKDKGLDTVELRYGIATAFALTGDNSLLSVAADQGTYVLTGDGFKAAKAIDAGLARPFDFSSTLFRDGPEGKQGALAILRTGTGRGHQALVFKATAQGMGHGHFDKLAWLFYDNGHEIITDYGAARFLNVEQKYGGHYLPENKTWAKQTVAHNTLVVDERSHFNGKLSVANEHHPDVIFFESNEDLQIASASMRNAYDEVTFTRTIALLDNVAPRLPIVVDVLRVESASAHQYDLPLHFAGQFIATSQALASSTDSLSPLGKKNGYQHLWLRASARLSRNENFAFTWLNDNRFYTYTALAHDGMEALFTQLGANDPDFNLRTEQAVILRARNKKAYAFVSVLEPHGEYNGPQEFTTRSEGSVVAVRRFSNNGADVISIRTRAGKEHYLGFSYDARADSEHEVRVGDRVFKWKGFYRLFESGEAGT